MTKQTNDAARVQLMLIVLVGLGSLGGAWLLYWLAVQGGVWGSTNNGRFVEPPLTVAELDLRSADGAPFATDGKWWLWVVTDGECADACRHAVHQLRQLHVLLNRDASRVRRALVTGGGEADPALLERYPQLEVLSGNLARLEVGLYIVDPIGNLVLHYPMSDAGEPVLDDLERLLEASHIG
ncbi:MAG TPA: hypothetical protein VF210_02955 [Pseudomonadales bacterium]